MATIISITPAQSDAIRATVDPASESLSLALDNGVRILATRVSIPWLAEGQHAGMYAFAAWVGMWADVYRDNITHDSDAFNAHDIAQRRAFLAFADKFARQTGLHLNAVLHGWTTGDNSDNAPTVADVLTTADGDTIGVAFADLPEGNPVYVPTPVNGDTIATQDHDRAHAVLTGLSSYGVGNGCPCEPCTTPEPVRVEIHRTDYYRSPMPADVPLYDTTWEPEWTAVGDGTTTTETFDSDPDGFDIADFGGPVLWAADVIRRLSCDHDLEPSVYPLPSAVPARTWLAATYESPYRNERTETSAYIYGLSDPDRAEAFRLAMLPGAEWVAMVHAIRYAATDAA